MRVLVALLISLPWVGCSRSAPTEHHVIPAGFSGVYKIERVSEHANDYRVDGTRYVFTIPESGVLRIASDVFDKQCLACNGLTAESCDGQTISLYSPLARPSDVARESTLLLGLLGSADALWYAVGTHEELTGFIQQIQSEKYQNLERYLPPKHPPQLASPGPGISETSEAR